MKVDYQVIGNLSNITSLKEDPLNHVKFEVIDYIHPKFEAINQKPSNQPKNNHEQEKFKTHSSSHTKRRKEIFKKPLEDYKTTIGFKNPYLD